MACALSRVEQGQRKGTPLMVSWSTIAWRLAESRQACRNIASSRFPSMCSIEVPESLIDQQPV